MANPNQSEKSVALDREENITRGNIAAKKVAVYHYDSDTDTLLPGTGDTPAGGASDPTAGYKTTKVDDATSTEYYGATDQDGAYLIKKITATDVQFATILNNALVTTFTDAWTDRATLTYGRLDEAF